MPMQSLPKISGKKYNAWCERQPLVFKDKDQCQRASISANRSHLTPFERAVIYFHELTESDGIEFVAFSNCRLEGGVALPNGVVVVPCFLPQSECNDPQNPLAQMTRKMEIRRRFVYDGWARVESWEDDSVRKAIRSIDEAISVFSLRTRVFFTWEPKYFTFKEERSTYHLEETDLLSFEKMAELFDSLGAADRNALYRSLGWLSQSIALDEPVGKFLFAILAIESLAWHIEKKAGEDSPLARLKTEYGTQADRRERREQCIRAAISELLDSDPTQAIRRAYNDCVVGIKQVLSKHLETLFAPKTEPVDLLFTEKVEDKTLYDLRHDIAHGRTDVLNRVQMDRIRKRVWDTERIARRYISTVIEKAFGAKLFSKRTMTAVYPINLQNVVVSSKGMYRGPVHMALIYM